MAYIEYEEFRDSLKPGDMFNNNFVELLIIVESEDNIHKVFSTLTGKMTEINTYGLYTWYRKVE